MSIFSKKFLFIVLISFAVLFLSLLSKKLRIDKEAEKLSGKNFDVIKIVPKNGKTYYTQGLFFVDDDILYESGGLYDKSTITKMKYPSMDIIKETKLKNDQFAEGIARVGDYVYQLTWRERVINKYKLDSLEKVDEIEMDEKMREGWGLTDYKDGEIIANDSTHRIFILDENTFKVKKIIPIYKNGNPINGLNDMAYDGKYLYSNVYFGTYILKIIPETGEIVDWYDMNSLVNYELNKETLKRSSLESGDVLNGIAYNSKRNIFVVTGKRWGNVYEVSFK